jgi:translation elongation factor EF-1alpha
VKNGVVNTILNVGVVVKSFTKEKPSKKLKPKKEQKLFMVIVKMDESYLYEDKKYQKIVELLKKIMESIAFTAPEGIEQKYYLLAEKYSEYFVFE